MRTDTCRRTSARGSTAPRRSLRLWGWTVAQAKEPLETYPHTRMVTHPVGPYVNDLELDEPWLIQRALEDPAHGS
jgi:hypothetical protein